MADVLGKSKPKTDPTPSVAATDPSDDDAMDPTDDDATDPINDDTTQSNGPQDPLGWISYQIKLVTKQGDTYTLQDTTAQVLEYKADARERVKVANSRDYKDNEAYVGIKIRLTNNGLQRTYPFDYRLYVNDPSFNNLTLEVENSSQGVLTSSEYVEVGKPIKERMYLNALDPPNTRKVKLYVHISGDHYPKKVTYRCEEPIG